MSAASPLIIAGREFSSRLLLGTGKFSSGQVMSDALEASGTQIVTVALRRADLERKSGKGDPFANILEFIDPERYLLLPPLSSYLPSLRFSLSWFLHPSRKESVRVTG